MLGCLSDMVKPKCWVKNAIKKFKVEVGFIWNDIFNTTFGFVHIWPNIWVQTTQHCLECSYPSINILLKQLCIFCMMIVFFLFFYSIDKSAALSIYVLHASIEFRCFILLLWKVTNNVIKWQRNIVHEIIVFICLCSHPSQLYWQWMNPYYEVHLHKLNFYWNSFDPHTLRRKGSI